MRELEKEWGRIAVILEVAALHEAEERFPSEILSISWALVFFQAAFLYLLLVVAVTSTFAFAHFQTLFIEWLAKSTFRFFHVTM